MDPQAAPVTLCGDSSVCLAVLSVPCLADVTAKWRKSEGKATASDGRPVEIVSA